MTVQTNSKDAIELIHCLEPSLRSIQNLVKTNKNLEQSNANLLEMNERQAEELSWRGDRIAELLLKNAELEAQIAEMVPWEDFSNNCCNRDMDYDAPECILSSNNCTIENCPLIGGKK